jgi:aspartate kinase
MNGTHTVEKIGGTSISWDGILDKVLLGERQGAARYGRLFVLSAYAGITDLLLENKRTGEPGVFGLYGNADAQRNWSTALDDVATRMLERNAAVLRGADRRDADAFVQQRIEHARSCLLDLQRLCGHGPFEMREYLRTVRELLAGIGEAHSTHNTVLLLRRHGVDATFVDLTGWQDEACVTLDEQLDRHIGGLDLTRTLPVVTGYAHCREGLITSYQRGYSEITFSRIAAATQAREAIIHKEYHLSSADPRIVGAEAAVPIGRTNYDVADQLSLLGMEAVHPHAARTLRRAGIALRVKRANEPEHAGTLIDADYKSAAPCVEIIAGRRSVYAFEVFDHEMLGRRGHQAEIQRLLDEHRIGIIARESNANTITHYLVCEGRLIDRLREALEERFADATVGVRRVSVVAAIGSDLDVPGLLAQCVGALAEADIPILAIHQSIRAVDIKFVVDDEHYEAAIVRLNERVIAPHVQRRVARVA